MRAIFRICGNESQPGLQIVEKLSTPLVTDLLYTNVQFTYLDDIFLPWIFSDPYYRHCRHHYHRLYDPRHQTTPSCHLQPGVVSHWSLVLV